MIWVKLSDLWKELSVCSTDKKLEIQKKINSIEKWMIDNNFGNIKEITDWSKKQKKVFRYESEKIHGYNPPSTARFGSDRCRMCIFNKHPWCDKGITKPCIGNV